MDVKEAEERTKIRAKYLRALEAEDWEVLPAPAYVRGFLRTYGALLGLDGERLADEYRRALRGAGAPPQARPPEPVLQRRRRPEDGSAAQPGHPDRGSRGGDRGAADRPGGARAATTATRSPLACASGQGPAKADGKRRQGQARSPSRSLASPIDFELEALGSVQVCVAARGEALVDSQVLAEGTTEQFSRRAPLPRRPAGRRRRPGLAGGGAEARLSADGEASWEANSNGIAEIEYAGPDCP